MENQAVEIFKKNKTIIFSAWIRLQLADPGLRKELMSSAVLEKQSSDLLNSFIENLSDENINSPRSADFEPVLDILCEISMSRAQQGCTPRETGTFVLSLKQALYNALQLDVKDPVKLNLQTNKVGKIIDGFSIATFETFIRLREDMINRQSQEISDIFTPVIQVWKGILALPIIGTVDSARAQIVMESLLQAMVERRSSIAIIDISGVIAVDSLVAQHLIKTVSATRLMGGECIISGIRADIAQTSVHLGIDLSNVITKPTLAAALRTAFMMTGMKVQRMQDPQRQFLS